MFYHKDIFYHKDTFYRIHTITRINVITKMHVITLTHVITSTNTSTVCKLTRCRNGKQWLKLKFADKDRSWNGCRGEESWLLQVNKYFGAATGLSLSHTFVYSHARTHARTHTHTHNQYTVVNVLHYSNLVTPALEITDLATVHKYIQYMFIHYQLFQNTAYHLQFFRQLTQISHQRVMNKLFR
jgi:hypothetical protein